jgi:pimeloyl-ACP methyl ester carboxylesterase
MGRVDDLTTTNAIRRAFTDLTHGQMHYRTAGTGKPLLTLHASPGSSKQLVSLINDLRGIARVFSPDTPGNGDSEPLPLEAPRIVDLADAMAGFLDSLRLDRVDLYGSHTGGAIAAELAILVPDRIGRVVIEGVQVLTPAERTEILARYALPFTADLDGAYLSRVFQFCRDQYLFYPWYERTRKNQRSGGLPRPEDLHNWVVEVLKAHVTYHLNYHAAFQWNARERLPLLMRPTLVLAAENDPLVESTREATRALPDGRYVALPRFDAPDFPLRRQTAIANFLSAGSP